MNDIQINWINDFSAQALATITLKSNDVIVINKGAVQPERVRLVIGPGTGLGTCGLINSSNGWVPLPAQGGHSDYAPNSSLEIEIWTLLKNIAQKGSPPYVATPYIKTANSFTSTCLKCMIIFITEASM